MRVWTLVNSISNKMNPIVSHINSCLQRHRSNIIDKQAPIPPLFVAFQGPQGSGKTFLTTQLRQTLTSAPYNLSVAILSIDDLYHTHDALQTIALKHPQNILLAGRGLPGTHDVALGSEILRRLKCINSSALALEAQTQIQTQDEAGGVIEKGKDVGGIRLPVFDKSLFGGQGDRIPSAGPLIQPPLDVVLFEGWCVGFCPTSPASIAFKFKKPIPDLEGILDLKSFCGIEDVLDINERLKGYVEWWDFFDAFVQIKPPDETPYSLIYMWRLQQEHDMKSKNGGRGMTDEEVKRFIDRYIPGYVFFGDGVTKGHEDSSGVIRPPRWLGNGLKVSIDENRELISTETF